MKQDDSDEEIDVNNLDVINLYSFGKIIEAKDLINIKKEAELKQTRYGYDDTVVSGPI